MAKLSGLFAAVFLCGVVSLPTAAATETVLYNFQGGSDGSSPTESLVADATGALYGTTTSGGGLVSGCAGCGGIVFKLTPPASVGGNWTETVLHRFHAGLDGTEPRGHLVIDGNGALYGTTYGGGSADGCSVGTGLANNGCGTVFKLTPPASGSTSWKETILYRFKGGTDGQTPMNGTVMSGNGTLYGTTARGGNTLCASGPVQGCGIVFSLAPPTVPGARWTERVLYRFTGGSYSQVPGALTLDANGVLFGGTFGSASCGRLGCGGVYRLTPPPSGRTVWRFSALYNFSSANFGISPVGSLLIGNDGVLYGMTNAGGNKQCQSFGCGVVFALHPPPHSTTKVPWTVRILHRFSGRAPDGNNPQNGLLMDSSGALYGTTVGGGSPPTSQGFTGGGIVFKLAPPAAGQSQWTQTVLHSFPRQYTDNVSDGSVPLGGLIADSNGVLYGTTAGSANPDNCCGTVFKLEP